MSDFVYTYLSLGIAVIVIVYGLMGKNFFKSMMLLLCSCIFSFCAGALFHPHGFLSTLLVLWLGIPSGIVAALIFLIVGYAFIDDENRARLFLKEYFPFYCY